MVTWEAPYFNCILMQMWIIPRFNYARILMAGESRHAILCHHEMSNS